jgi:hypothetical protein
LTPVPVRGEVFNEEYFRVEEGVQPGDVIVLDPPPEA